MQGKGTVRTKTGKQEENLGTDVNLERKAVDETGGASY